MSVAAAKRESPLAGLLSGKMGEMQVRVDDLTRKYARLWLETPATFPDLGSGHSRDQKRELEREVTLLLDRIEQSRQQGALDRAKLQETMQQAGGGIEELCGRAGLYFDPSFTAGFERATREFLRKVKAFDAGIAPESIYQAMRNIWIANSLQALMEREMDCPDPVFAYSMLYPYSDNVNDDPGLSFAGKCDLNDHFRRWLEGEEAAPRNATEQKIHALVQLIEGTFARSRHPAVFQSLLAIFNAQVKSLIQQKHQHAGGASRILEISVEKGGTSVLADGYLIEGALDEEFAEFCFGYGVFLQFADDLQDVADDLANGHQTLYSQIAEKAPLDALASRLFNFMQQVVDLHLAGQRHRRFRELILKNCCFMVQEAVCKTTRFYSPGYLRAIERHFPLTLPFYLQVKKQLKKMLLEQRPQLEGLAV